MRNRSDQLIREQGSLFASGSSRNELIKIQDYNGQKAVSARELYLKLGLAETQWPRWSKKNITENEFAVENADYQILRHDVEHGRPVTDFALTIDFAKKICMLARTQAGEEIRQYFIECEKSLKEIKPLSTFDLMELSIKKLREQEKEISDVKQRVNILEAKTGDQSESDYMAIKGFARLIQMSVDNNHAKILGMRASSICRERSIDIKKIHDQRFGAINIYPISILEEVFKIRLA